MTDLTPGMYPGVSYADYVAWPGLRVSTLKYAQYSARHLKWALDGRLEREETDALRLGTAIHRRLLEPERYEIFTAIAKPCCAELKSGARKGEQCGLASSACDDADNWYCGTHAAGREVSKPTEYVTESEAAMIEELNHEIRQHPVVKLLRAHGGCEVSAFCEIEGVPMKCRMDKVIEPQGDVPATVIDIKTKPPMSCSYDQCQKQAATLAYHVQADVYRRVLSKLNGWDDVAVVHLFVEKGPPYDCCVVQSTYEDMVAGNNAFLTWIRTYKQGMETGEWPGSCTDFAYGLLPDWALKREGVNR